MKLSKDENLGSLWSHQKNESAFLTVIDKMPFEVKRIFWSYHDRDDHDIHGHHAHKKNKQLLICLAGRFRVQTISRTGVHREFIMSADDYYFHDAMEWLSYCRANSSWELDDTSVLLSLNSMPYDPSDYIHSMKDFLEGKV